MDYGDDDQSTASFALDHERVPMTRKVPSATEWDSQKDIIKSLYITNDLTLPQVVRAMAEEHNFKATGRMYKSRFTGWGLNKNVSQRDWQSAAVMRYNRQKEGKDTTGFRIHGRTKTLQDLRRYINGSPVSEREFVDKALAEGVTGDCAHIRCMPSEDARSKLSSSSSGQPSISSAILRGTQKWTPNSSGGSRDSQGHPSQQTFNRGQFPRIPDAQQRQLPTPSATNIAASMPDLLQGPPHSDEAHSTTDLSRIGRDYVECDHIQQEMGIILAETFSTDAMHIAFPEMRDSEAWQLIDKPDSAAEQRMCPKCQTPSRNHSPLPSNWYLERSAELPQALHYQTLPPDKLLPGSDEAFTFGTYCFAACMYGNQGRFDFLAMSLQEADKLFEEMLTHNNPMALLSLLRALTILHAHDRGSMAESIVRVAHHVSKRVLTEGNPFTLLIEWLTAAAGQTLRSPQVRVKAATLRNIKMQMEQAFTPDHPNALVATYCLAFQLILDKALEEAERLLLTLVGTSGAVLGECDLMTVATLNTLGRAQKRQKKYDQAIATLEKSLQMHPLGPNHPYRLDSLKQLAKLYKLQQRTDLVESIYKTVLIGRLKTLGIKHSFTEEARLDLERSLKESGKWDDHAEEEIQKLFERGAFMGDYEAF